MTLRATGQVVGALAVCAAIAVCTPLVTKSRAQSVNASQKADSGASPIYGVTIPPGYRDWGLIAVAQLTRGKSDNPALIAANMRLRQLRSQLNNDLAIKTFPESTLPFPDGTMIAALYWNEVSSDQNNKVLASGFYASAIVTTTEVIASMSAL